MGDETISNVAGCMSELASQSTPDDLDTAKVDVAANAEGEGSGGETQPRPVACIAATLTQGNATLLHLLALHAAPNITPAFRGVLFRLAKPAGDEVAAFDRFAALAAEAAEPSVATTICAALAASIVARAWMKSHDSPSTADCEMLLDAWFDAAKAVCVNRGPAGLLHLLPVARGLARRVPAQNGSMAEITATVRRMATRIEAVPANDRSAAWRQPDRAKRSSLGPPHRLFIHGPVEIVFHPR